MRVRDAIAATTLLLAGRAGADEPASVHPHVHIDVDKCVAVANDEVKKVVTVELGALVVDDTTGPITHVRTSCKGGLVEITVDDPITGKSLTRSVDILASPPKARGRLLALAIVELVSASWTELESNPTPRVPPAGPKAPDTQRDAARATIKPRAVDMRRTVRIIAIGEERFFFPRTGPLHGVGVRVGGEHWFVGWSADMIYALGSVSAPLGSISADLVSAGLSANVHFSSEVLTTRFGPGVRFGSARFSGVPSDDASIEGRSVRGPWVAPFAHASITLHPFAGPLSFDGGVEAGWVVIPVRANVDGERRAAAAGPTVAITLGIGIAL